MTKFYDDMYGRSRDRSEQKGIKLWSDWNTQIYDWAKSYALEHVCPCYVPMLPPLDCTYSGLVFNITCRMIIVLPFVCGQNAHCSFFCHSDCQASSFGYHAVHIEDLVSDTLVVRYTAIHHLAHWVGSGTGGIMSTTCSYSCMSYDGGALFLWLDASL